MSEKIVGLKGEYVPIPGEPDPQCVELFERLLADARAGKLHAVGVACDYVNDGVRWSLVGTGMGFDMIGALEMIKRNAQDRMP